MQETVAGPADLIGDASQTALGGVVTNIFQRSVSAASKKHGIEAFALGERAGILHHLDQAAIIPHVAETEDKKFPYEVSLPGTEHLVHLLLNQSSQKSFTMSLKAS